MARSTFAAALVLAGLAVGATACDTTTGVPLPAPVSVPSVPGGAPAPAPEQDDDGTVAPPPAGNQEDGDDGGEGAAGDDDGDDG